MVVNIHAELDKIQDVSRKINTIGLTIGKDVNISAAIKAAHIVVVNDFVKHMTKAAITNPSAFSHMYEWNRTGDPNSRLWKHVLRGGGKSRKSTFEFKASKTSVPVHPKLAEVGVKQRHIFYWKAPIMEYGLPVRISRKIADALVYLHKGTRGSATSRFDGWVVNGIVYRKSPVIIQRSGNKNIWFSFTNEYTRWFSSSGPQSAISQNLSKQLSRTIGKTAIDAVKSVNRKGRSKTIEINPLAYDQTVGRKLQEALNRDYAAAAKNRMVE